MAKSTLKRVEALRAGRGEKDSDAPVYYEFGEKSVMVPNRGTSKEFRETTVAGSVTEDHAHPERRPR
jgi:hypothetical protein